MRPAEVGRHGLVPVSPVTQRITPPDELHCNYMILPLRYRARALVREQSFDIAD